MGADDIIQFVKRRYCKSGYNLFFQNRNRKIDLVSGWFSLETVCTDLIYHFREVDKNTCLNLIYDNFTPIYIKAEQGGENEKFTISNGD